MYTAINLQIPFCPWRLENLSPIVGFLCQKYANIYMFKQTVVYYYEFSNTFAFRCWTDFNCDSFKSSLPSVFWCCWLGVRKSIQPVKIEWWGAGMVIWTRWIKEKQYIFGKRDDDPWTGTRAATRYATCTTDFLPRHISIMARTGRTEQASSDEGLW